MSGGARRLRPRQLRAAGLHGMVARHGTPLNNPPTSGKHPAFLGMITPELHRGLLTGGPVRGRGVLVVGLVEAENVERFFVRGKNDIDVRRPPDFMISGERIAVVVVHSCDFSRYPSGKRLALEPLPDKATTEKTKDSCWLHRCGPYCFRGAFGALSLSHPNRAP